MANSALDNQRPIQGGNVGALSCGARKVCSHGWIPEVRLSGNEAWLGCGANLLNSSSRRNQGSTFGRKRSNRRPSRNSSVAVLATNGVPGPRRSRRCPALIKVAIDSGLGLFNIIAIAVVNDRAGHSAEN